MNKPTPVKVRRRNERLGDWLETVDSDLRSEEAAELRALKKKLIVDLCWLAGAAAVVFGLMCVLAWAVNDATKGTVWNP